ncbi:unnamed protein product, partial [Callosobruchus maculatus]
MENLPSTSRDGKNVGELDEAQISPISSRGGTPVPARLSREDNRIETLTEEVNQLKTLLRQQSAMLQLLTETHSAALVHDSPASTGIRSEENRSVLAGQSPFNSIKPMGGKGLSAVQLPNNNHT